MYFGEELSFFEITTYYSKFHDFSRQHQGAKQNTAKKTETLHVLKLLAQSQEEDVRGVKSRNLFSVFSFIC